MIVAPAEVQSSTVTNSIPDRVLNRLVQRTAGLRMLPSVASQALQIAKDPNCSLSEFARIIERDAVLATDILRLSNSVMFKGVNKVLSLNQAVIRIGFRICHNLILASCFNSFAKRLDMSEEWIREILCRHGYLTGLIAVNLNNRFRIGFQGEEFTGGMMHDFGRMLIAVCYPEQFDKIDPMSFEESESTPELETNEIGASHCEIGAWFMEHNGLPRQLVEVLLHHHSPMKATEHRHFVALIAASDHMANHMQRCGEPAGYEPESNSAFKILEELGFGEKSTKFEQVACEIMTSAQDAVSQMFI